MFSNTDWDNLIPIDNSSVCPWKVSSFSPWGKKNILPLFTHCRAKLFLLFSIGDGGRGEGEGGLFTFLLWKGGVLLERGLNVGFTVGIETVSCRSSVATDGQHGHGLKLETHEPIIIIIIIIIIITIIIIINIFNYYG